MPSSIMAGKKARKTPAADDAAAATDPPKSSMEESANALAGIEGALTGSKRKGTASSSASQKKKTTKSEAAASSRPRSNSIERLSEVAGTLLKDGAAAVPNPMATVVTATSVPALPPLQPAAGSTAAVSAAAAAPAPATGFRKKTPKSASAKPTATKKTIDAKNKKAQITYNPDIPMTKEQLTAWRREMRRVRNRESAAASRRKVRDRIEELEEEVQVWKKRYHEVMAKLGKVDGDKGSAKEEGVKSEEPSGEQGKDGDVSADV